MLSGSVGALQGAGWMKVRSESEVHAFAASTMESYGSELHRYLRSRIASSQDLGDLTQEVYLRLIRVQKPDEVLNPLAYLFGIAANVVSEFRLRERRERVVYDSDVMQAAAEAPVDSVCHDVVTSCSSRNQGWR